jgi:hypothetical protein
MKKGLKTENPDGEFEINTGRIFSHINHNWSHYDRNFLRTQFQDALITSLNKKKIISQVYSDLNKDYFQRYSDNYKHELEYANDINMFPFLNYYLKYNKKDDPFPSIIDFDADNLLNPDDANFDLFFALKITTVDMFKLNAFLNYHLRKTFRNRNIKFADYLKNLSRKYDNFIKKSYQDALGDFIDSLKPKRKVNKKKQSVKNVESKPENHLPDTNKQNEKLNDDEKKSKVRWIGTNETEFVQLIYGLFQANLITNQGNKITKLVPEFAELLNFSLWKNWQSNHSKSVRERNNDYVPPIFAEIKTAYTKYSKREKEE